MQTSQTTVSNTEVNETQVRLLMDSGSQRTYITEDLAKRLKLKKKATEEITLVPFGENKPKTLRTTKITGSILRRPLQMDVCENMKYLCNSLQLADTLPSGSQTSTIEILVGNDYYLDIILPQKIEIQQGLYLLGSKVGWILTGRSQLISRDGHIRSGKVMLPNKKNLNQALSMLYPIECEEVNEDLTNSDTEKDTELINDNINTTRERPQRQAD
ncbi:unnamed protein product [Mytilus coruscus]|uniref:DUF1758 domain-containing protein n=1 Tax=Mytilus coruscus TaxID=42192 RepID=A0A6J8ETB5_MYTCO|nr:unnamed protein product [Mytilus coruscus]